MHIEVTDDYSCKENKSVRLTATSGRTTVLSRKLRRIGQGKVTVQKIFSGLEMFQRKT